ncbi:MAG TPA: hypothetical protein VJR89_34745 [Polyangiales bacterium]|nr:hypothetical protein [Polyangiales bacterium]
MLAGNPQPSSRELARFGLGLTVGLCVASLAAWIGIGPFTALGPSPLLAAALICAALWVGVSTAFAPERNRVLQRAAFAIARAIAWVTLLVFFFGVLTPLGVGARLFGYDPLQRRGRRDSYWRPHRARKPSSYFHQS